MPGHSPGEVAFRFGDHGASIVGDALDTLNIATGAVGPSIAAGALNVQANRRWPRLIASAGASALFFRVTASLGPLHRCRDRGGPGSRDELSVAALVNELLIEWLVGALAAGPLRARR